MNEPTTGWEDDHHAELSVKQKEADYWKAQAEANAKDAARYRWLRAQHWFSGQMAVVRDPKASIKLGCYCPSRDRLDEAIDSAMSEKEKT